MTNNTTDGIAHDLASLAALIAQNDDGGRLTGGDETPRQTARLWLAAGLTPQQSAEYIAAGCWDFSRCAELAATGITGAHLVDKAVIDRLGGDGFLEVLGYRHSNGDVSTAQIHRAIAAAASGVELARVRHGGSWWRLLRTASGAIALESISDRSLDRGLCWAYACDVSTDLGSDPTEASSAIRLGLAIGAYHANRITESADGDPMVTV